MSFPLWPAVHPRRSPPAILVGSLAVIAGCADQHSALPSAPEPSVALSRVASSDSLSELDAVGGHRHIMPTLARARQAANALSSNRVINGKISYHGGFVIAGTD